MRTSNKIILGIFVAPLLAVTLVHVALYAKIKAGHVEVMKTVMEDRYTRGTYAAVNKIAVYGINYVTIRPSDSLKIEIEKGSGEHFYYTSKADSLVIHGDSLIRRQDGSTEAIRSYRDVNLYVPSGVSILLNNTDGTIWGSPDSLKAPSYKLAMLNHASLGVKEPEGTDKHVYFNHLSVNASNTEGLQLNMQCIIADLELAMAASMFNDNGASIGALKVEADSVSNISLKGSNLSKLK